jgi:hypothetical protein
VETKNLLDRHTQTSLGQAEGPLSWSQFRPKCATSEPKTVCGLISPIATVSPPVPTHTAYQLIALDLTALAQRQEIILVGALRTIPLRTSLRVGPC